MKMPNDRWKRKAGVGLFWILVWLFLSYFVDNSLFLPGPGKVIAEFFRLTKQGDFVHRVFFSFFRILLGFFLAQWTAAILAGISYRNETVRSLLQPFVQAIQSVPVASFVILALFWMKSEALSVFICFLIVFPVIFHNVLEGLFALDPRLSQMGEIFRLSSFDQFRAIVLPQLAPYLEAAQKTAIGLAWKAGTAAEIIAMVKGSIGEALYDSKIYLEMPRLFALTLWIILFSALSSFFLTFLFKKVLLALQRKKPKKRKNSPSIPLSMGKKEPLVCLQGVKKDYGKGPLLQDFSYTFFPGEVTWIRGKSGSGKTTLLNLMMGLLSPDKGEILPAPGLRFCPLFQENRLIESWTVRENLLLVQPKAAEDLSENLKALGLSGLEGQKVEALSGGMKRRVAIARAVLCPGDFLLLDEPFRDLDQHTKDQTLAWINEKKASFQGLVLVSHDPKEAEALGYTQWIEIKPR